MTAFCSRRFEARIETLKNYIFFDSLINEDYHTKLNDIENIAIALEKYMACKHCAKFLTPFISKTASANFIILPGLCFTPI